LRRARSPVRLKPCNGALNRVLSGKSAEHGQFQQRTTADVIGAMHAAGSQNHATLEPYPMWLKLVRDGDRLYGYLSYDGKNWTVSRSTDQVKGLAPAVHIGLAAGSCDEISYTVEFSDFKVEAEKEGWKN